MAIFNEAFQKILHFEGGHSKKTDSTYLGISKEKYPDWIGWKILDNEREGSINREVMNFYKLQFWDVIRGDEILSQVLANKFFNTSVCEYVGVEKCVEYICLALNKLINTNLNKSGIDSDILNTLNSFNKNDTNNLIKIISALQLNCCILSNTERINMSNIIERSFYDGT